MSNTRVRYQAHQTVVADDAPMDVEKVKQSHFEVERLKSATTYENPMLISKPELKESGVLSDEDRRIMYDPRPQDDVTSGYPISCAPFTLKLASPRESLHFNPETVVVGIVTCGGLCPGLNDVIRSLTRTAILTYNVRRVIGFRYGFWGLSAAGRHTAIDLTLERVHHIHRHGGTMLGSSRGPQSMQEMADTLEALGVNILFTVGGDGTQKGACAIGDELRRRGADIAVVGIPKTIDNDLALSHRTFGYETAVDEAVLAIRAAAAEAMSHMYGVGIVKVMGRHSGFIAAQATVSSAMVNICLIPEMQISQEVFFKLIERRFLLAKYCVIVVAEGFGQNWGSSSGETDASGNKKLIDIGAVMRDMVTKYLKDNKKLYPQSTVKYIDPSYMIRACPPSSSDAFFCSNLSTLAVHEAMAGHTNCLVASWYSTFVLVPIKLATSLRKVVCIKGALWRQVREVTVDIDGDPKEAIRRGLQRELRAASDERERLIGKLSKL